MHLEVTIPGDHVGSVTSDLNTRRGRMEGMDPLPGNMTVVQARAPLSELMTYARSLSSITGGQGAFTMDFSHYEQVPPHEQQKIVAAAQIRHDDET
jgi:elongation factor G